MSAMLRRLLAGNGYLTEGADDGTGGGAGGGGGETPEQKVAREKTEADAAAAAAGKPNDKEAKLLKEVMEKKGKITELSTQLSQVNEKLKQFEGIDPAKVKALLAEQASLEEKKLAAEGNWQKLKDQMNEAHATALKAKDEAYDLVVNTTKSLEAQISDLTVGNAFATSGFIRDELTLTPGKARVVYGPHFEFKDGVVTAYDKPTGAKGRTMLVDGKGDPLAFEEAMKKIVEGDPERDAIKKAKIKQGAGSNNGNGSGKPGAGDTPVKSAREKIAAGLKGIEDARRKRA